MLAIPIPFVVSFLLGLLAITLHVRFGRQTKLACGFIILCAASTCMVGLRWTFDISLFKFSQPVLASIIPIAAWYAFAYLGQNTKQLPWWHYLVPCYISISAINQASLPLPLDEILSLAYCLYGLALIRQSRLESTLQNVALGHWVEVKKAKKVAGGLLLFSAIVDTLMSIDFAINQGTFSPYILTAAHLILLPALSFAVVILCIHTPQGENQAPPIELDKEDSGTLPPNQGLTQEKAEQISALLHDRLKKDTLYLDPELTLSKLSRKLTIPAKHISMAINQTQGKNISSFINEYRIEDAKKALRETQTPITQILLSSGFQTKSNFNREFLRVTGTTPSAYRKQTCTPND
ncbi:helix-turn-helix domain-containing protein [Marinomonas epiphytica]